MSCINFYRFAADLAAEIGSKYSGGADHRRKLHEYMLANDWFGMCYSVKSPTQINVLTDDAERIRPPLALWLSALDRPSGVKTELLLSHFKDRFPAMCELFGRYIKGKHLDGTYAYWHLLDSLFSEMTKDISDHTEEDIEQLAARMGDELPLNAANIFSSFLSWLSANGSGISGWEYKFHRREQPGVDHGAYSIKQFSVAAYCIFNAAMWDRHQLVAKAVGSRVCADLWVYAALNTFCALRVGDLKRLPAPRLPIGNAEAHRLALDGSFPPTVSRAITQDLETRVELLGMTPSKTSSCRNVPGIKLHVPESLREPFGMIMAIALAHHPGVKPGDRFVSANINHRVTKAFLGKEMVNTIGRFVPRRCNKAYLQGIEAVGGADNAPGKPKGYMLAALARSHKGGFGTLSQATDAYLKDARFVGYTPEFIAREMFERGVFSFIPAVLLEMYAGERYRKLPVRAQTALILNLGLSAHEIERIAEVTAISLAKSREAVRGILSGYGSVVESIFTMLQNIAAGNAPSRQDEHLCLMTAAGCGCPFPGRACCLGCGYEIYTKSTMHTLMKEYARIKSLRLTANSDESLRHSRILETAVFPAVSEILAASQILYPENDNTELLEIMEKGIEYVDNNIRIGGN